MSVTTTITCDGCGGTVDGHGPTVRVRGSAPLYACKTACKVIVFEKLRAAAVQQVADEAAAAAKAAADKIAKDKADAAEAAASSDAKKARDAAKAAPTPPAAEKS
jgi:hypothetical protein